MPFSEPEFRPEAFPGAAFQGWTWRGARLEFAELAAYRSGERVKHLGQARTRLDAELDFPVLLRVFAQEAWLDPQKPGEVVFPVDSIFKVLGVRTLSENRTCLWLEQILPGRKTLEGLGEDIQDWLARMAGPLPSPGPGLEELWQSPFARWAPEAVAGDEPLKGVIYDFAEAVAFVGARTGLDEGLVEQVLDAASRYLELAGTAQGAQDEGLLRERDAMRHLLPEEASVLDPELQMAYLVLVTGLEEDLIDRVLDGDLDYLRSLGLVEDDEEYEEGAADSGAPWHAVFRDLPADLLRHLEEVPDIANLRFAVPSPDPAWAMVAAVALPQGGRLETLRLDGTSSESSDLMAIFPVARDGAEHRLKIQGIERWESGCGATVEASAADGMLLTFFDVDHLHPWNDLEEGSEAQVALAGFALALAPAWGSALSLLGEPEDECAFQGRVASVDVLSAWGGLVYRLDLVGADGFTLPLYAAQHVLAEGYRPRIGDEVGGSLWLQGGRVGGAYTRPIICEG